MMTAVWHACVRLKCNNRCSTFVSLKFHFNMICVSTLTHDTNSYHVFHKLVEKYRVFRMWPHFCNHKLLPLPIRSLHRLLWLLYGLCNSVSRDTYLLRIRVSPGYLLTYHPLPHSIEWWLSLCISSVFIWLKSSISSGYSSCISTWGSLPPTGGVYLYCCLTWYMDFIVGVILYYLLVATGLFSAGFLVGLIQVMMRRYSR